MTGSNQALSRYSWNRQGKTSANSKQIQEEKHFKRTGGSWSLAKDVGTESLENFVHTSNKPHIRLGGRETVLPCVLCVTNDSISSSKAGNSLHLQGYDNTGVCLLQNLTYM